MNSQPLNIRGLTLTTLRNKNVDRIGIRTSDGIIDVQAASNALGIAQFPLTVEDVIAGKGNVNILQELARTAPPETIHSESSVEYGPVISNPPKIICVGLNYREHIAESGSQVPDFPDLFNKYNNSLNRHKGTINVSELPAVQFDYESELVIIMGKTARNVPESDALTYVFGYAAGNDFSARDLQMRVSQWMTGKTPDHFAPLGPWLVSADQIP